MLRLRLGCDSLFFLSLLNCCFVSCNKLVRICAFFCNFLQLLNCCFCFKLQLLSCTLDWTEEQNNDDALLRVDEWKTRKLPSGLPLIPQSSRHRVDCWSVHVPFCLCLAPMAPVESAHLATAMYRLSCSVLATFFFPKLCWWIVYLGQQELARFFPDLSTHLMSNIVMLLLHLCVTRSNDASWLWLCFVGELKKFWKSMLSS
jgi:hypothetical protein